MSSYMYVLIGLSRKPYLMPVSAQRVFLLTYLLAGAIGRGAAEPRRNVEGGPSVNLRPPTDGAQSTGLILSALELHRK